MDPLVSILIPAFNSESWIAETLQSAIRQSYPNKEIILVDDGSSDQTLSIARTFESRGVRVYAQQNAGGAAARNTALSYAQGDYIQWLDHDDLLAPNKLSAQVDLISSGIGDRVLISGKFGIFYFRPSTATFNPGPLWRDLSNTEYFLEKFQKDTWLHTTCWLVSRRLTEAAGPWLDLRSPDDDGEYFCRVAAAASEIRFVDQATSYWRVGNTSSFSYSRVRSKKALEALIVSTFKCIEHFLELENTERSRAACVTFLKNRLIYYYPEHFDLAQQLCDRARQLGGEISEPPLLPKYEAIKNIFGWKAAKSAQAFVPKFKYLIFRNWDRLMHQAV